MFSQAIAVRQEPVVPTETETPARPKASVEEYLERERRSKVRHEYVDGEIIAMAGESPRHNVIAGNIYRKFGNEFEERPRQAFIENVRVRVTPTQYRYPDVVALCGEAKFDQDNPPALLNPMVIIEVLSPSTLETDREEKFAQYRQNDALTDYVLVEQDKRLVIHYARVHATKWEVSIYTQQEEALIFAGLEVLLSLAEIYRKIVFDTPETPEPSREPNHV